MPRATAGLPTHSSDAWSHCSVKNTPPFMCNDEEAVQHAECQRRDGEKVHGCDHFAVVAQKCRPSLRRLGVPWCFLHPAQYGSLGDIEAEHPEFAVNAGCAPGRIFGHDAEDELA
jgi:hypothetical protein